jgi:hypothetical protein
LLGAPALKVATVFVWPDDNRTEFKRLRVVEANIAAIEEVKRIKLKLKKTP